MPDETGEANTSVVPSGTSVSIELGDLKASIAAELASELSTPDDIRRRYGLSHDQWKLLKANPMFRGMITDALKTFRGPLNAGTRITKKAEILLEDSMPDLYSMAKAQETPSSERIKAIQTLAELAGRGKSAQPVQPGPSGGGFTLNIQIGDNRQVKIEGTS